MIAEDYADHRNDATKIYQIIKHRLLNTSPEKMLPVLYVLDSVLKNAKGCFIELVEQEAVDWMPTVHAQLETVPNQQKLQKVWRTWNEPFRLFSSPEAWKAMGRCFSDTNDKVKVGGSSSQTVAGIARTVRVVKVLCAFSSREIFFVQTNARWCLTLCCLS